MLSVNDNEQQQQIVDSMSVVGEEEERKEGEEELEGNIYIIAVPRYHENLYKHVEKEHKWLAESISGNSDWYHYHKKLYTIKDRERFEKLIKDLRTEKSELFIDPEYHPKPQNQSRMSYIHEFLKTKSVGSYYTFTEYYRITDYSNSNVVNDNKQEYILVPLLIRLKRGKTFDQSKRVVGLDPNTGEVIVEKINPRHFYKEKELAEEEQKEQERRERLDKIMG